MLIEKAIGESKKQCDLYSKNDSIGYTELSCNSKGTKTGYTYRGGANIITLDELEPLLSNVAMIKMDIEGYEYNALLGGKKILTQLHVPYIVTTFSPAKMNKHGSNNAYNYLNQFETAGYKFSLTGFDDNFVTINSIMQRLIIYDSVDLFLIYSAT